MMRIEKSERGYRSYGNGIIVHELANIAGEVEVGPNTRIDAFTTITGQVTIGRGCHLGANVAIFGTAGVRIGDECSLSAGSKIFTGTFDRATGHRANPMLDDVRYVDGPVTLGNRCILGCNSIILPNVSLTDDVLVGALSLVKVSLSAGVYAGIPVRRIAR